MQQQPPPSQSQYRPAGGQHHHGHHISMPPTVSVATGAVINPAQANPNAASAQQPQQQQPKVVMYFQPQDPSSVSVSAATGQVFVHQPNFVYSQHQPRMAFYPPPPMYQTGVTPTFSTAQPLGYTQPPPTMPTQVPQPRPQTPPNQAATAMHPAMQGAQMPIHGSPYINQTATVPTHHMQGPTTLATAAQPPPHNPSQPASNYQTPAATSMAPSRPYVKKPRSNAIKIINPETQEEVDPSGSKPVSSAPSEGSPAPSEAASTSDNKEVKDEPPSKDETTPINEVDKEAEKKESSPETSVEIKEDNSKSKQKNKREESNAEKPREKTPAAVEAVTKEAVEKDTVDSFTSSSPVSAATEVTENESPAPVEQPTAAAAEKEVETKTNHVEQAVVNHVEQEASPEPEKQADEESEKAESLENGTATSSAASSTPASKSGSQIKLKYEYPAEQWSPINTEGKKQYGREFLVKLSTDPLSKMKPPNLPNMDIIKDRMHQDKAKFPLPTNQNKDWTPGFVKSTSSKPGMNTKGGSRDKGAKRTGPPQVIDLRINTNIELNKSENAWRPDKLRAESEDPLVELERNVRSILNKLTPQKFDKLVTKFNDLPIDTEQKLKIAIELIFEKAVDEPEFSVAYAKMCLVLREKKVETDQQKTVDFRKILVSRCQKEFERDYMEDFDRKKFEEELNAAGDEEKKKQMLLEFEEQERRARRRSLGNIRFIGELYNLKMLTDRIMHEIINKQIQQIDEESLECLCWLLNTIGKVLDQATQARFNALTAQPGEDVNKAVVGLKPFDYYFSEMEGIIKTKSIPSRVRFMLLDVIDLRRNNWKPRREKAGPKTLDQIHKEAEREKTQAKLMEMQPLPSSVSASSGGGGGNNRGDRGDRDNRKRSQRGGPQQTDDEWSTVAYSRSTKNPNFNERIDAQKVINLAASGRKDADSMTFGPGNRVGWGKGSGQKTPSQQSSNRFAAMQQNVAGSEQTEHRRNYSASMGNFARGTGSRGASVADQERQEAIDAVKHFSGAVNNGPDKGAPRGSQTVVATNNAPVGGPSMSVGNFGRAAQPATVSEAQMAIGQTQLLKGNADLSSEILERKAKSVIAEYLHLASAESALDDICKDFHPSHMKDVSEKILMEVLERNSKDMTKTGELLDYLVTKHALLPSQLEASFFTVFEFSLDLEIDIPMLWQNVGMILAPILASEKSLQMKFLLDSVKLLDEKQVPQFLKQVLANMVTIKGRDKAGEIMRRSNLSLSQLMPSEKVADFIASSGFDFLEVANSSDVKSNVARLLDMNPKQNDAVISWIEENVPLEDRKENPKDFIRTLARAVTENSLKYDEERGDWKFNEDQFQARCPLLKRFVDADLEREKHVIYSLQHLMHELEHPNKLLTNIFYGLYNNDVISEDGFEAWLRSNDPAEEVGKGVASKSTTHFFTWMRENDEMNEEEDLDEC